MFLSYVCIIKLQGLGVKTYAQVINDQLIGEYIGGVEKADLFKYSKRDDVMSLLESRYPSRSR